MKTDGFGIESGAGAFFGKALVVEYDDRRRFVRVLSVHDDPADADDALALARRGEHLAQLVPPSTGSGGAPILLGVAEDVRPY